MKLLLAILTFCLAFAAVADEDYFPDELETVWMIPQLITLDIELVGGGILLHATTDHALNYRSYYGHELPNAKSYLGHIRYVLQKIIDENGQSGLCPLQIALNASTDIAANSDGGWGKGWVYWANEEASAKAEVERVQKKIRDFYIGQTVFFTVGSYGLIEGATRFYLVCEHRDPGYFPLTTIGKKKAARVYRVLRTLEKRDTPEHPRVWHFSP